MKDWIAALREGDPAAAEPLTRDAADAMRRLVVATAREERRPPVWWPRALAFASVVALMVVASAIGARQIGERGQVATPGAAGAALESGERRQLQFSTPGGTRIIWVFNSEFRLKETMP
jgi:hypothetical protein